MAATSDRRTRQILAEKRTQAYRKGTAMRIAKAQLKRDLAELPTREGLFLVADVIEKVGRYETAMPGELVQACYRVGVARARAFMLEANVPATVKLRDLPADRRRAIAEEVRRFAKIFSPATMPRGRRRARANGIADVG